MSLTHYVRNAVAFARTARRGQSPRPAAGAISLPIFVINLERAEHRRRWALNHLAHLGLHATLSPAVDGRALDVDALQRKGVYQERAAVEAFSRGLSPAEIGCTLSHVRIYERMIKEGIDSAIILEDDAMLVEDVHERVARILSELPDDWGLVQFIYRCQDHEAVGGSLVRFLMQKCMPVSSTGYLINRHAAAKMVEAAYPVRYPADSFIGRSWRWGVKVYGARPQLVRINSVFSSDIYEGKGLRASVGKRVKNVIVRLLG